MLIVGSSVPSLCAFWEGISVYICLLFLLLLSCATGSARIGSTSSQVVRRSLVWFLDPITLIFLSLLFWISLLFSLQGISLLVWTFFPSFPRILGVQQREKSLFFWVVFLAFPKKNKEKKISVIGVGTIPVDGQYVRFFLPLLTSALVRTILLAMIPKDWSTVCCCFEDHNWTLRH